MTKVIAQAVISTLKTLEKLLAKRSLAINHEVEAEVCIA